MSNDAPGDVLMVASQFSCALDFFDMTTLEKVATVSDLIAQPHEMAWDPGRRLAYLAHTYRSGAYGEGKPKAHEISVIDVDSRAVVEVIDVSPFEAPHDVEYDPGADLIYTGVEAGDGGNGVLVIDAKTRSVTASVPLEARNTHWMCITPDGAKAYCAHKETPFVSVVDLRERRQLGTIASPGGAEEIDASPDGRFVFAATPMMSLVINVAQGQLNKATPPPGTPSPRLLKIDVATDEVVGQLDFAEYLSALRVAPDGRVIVTEFRFPEPGAQPGSPVRGRVNVVDPDSLELLASIEADELPFTTRFSPDGETAFVANLKTGSVSVIDLRSYTLVATLDNNIGPAFGGSHGMCFVPARTTG
ncbi:MAG TPA: YncE family protein [Pseudonocardia sp.]|nr:YncE family protein [Pseudonocardia sp.]